MKAGMFALVFLAVLGLLPGGSRAVRAQAPTMTVTVAPSPNPIPLTIVRGTLVLFQGPISQQMSMTTIALRNDYGVFAKGDFLDSWKLLWNTAAERDGTSQVAVFWSRGGSPAARLARYNITFLDPPSFTLTTGPISGGKMPVTATPTRTLTAQKYTLTVDGRPISTVLDSQGSGVVDTSALKPGSHTLGASAVLKDGTESVIAPVTFLVHTSAPWYATTGPHNTAPAKRKPARKTKSR